MGKKRRTRKKVRRSRRRRRTRRTSRSCPLWLLALTVVAAGIVVFLIGRQAFFFVTEAGYDPSEPYPVKGVDVSIYQGDIDWEGLRSEDIEFVFIKATEGASYVDKNFETNWDGARKAGIAAGAYHFMSFDTDGEKQADNFIETVDKSWGALPPALDVELYGDYIDKHPSKNKVYETMDIILERLEERYGKKPLIYTNNHFYDMYISGKYDEYPIWISDHDIPETLADGRKWTFCQYTFEGSSEYIAGGEKYVDFNVFNGTGWEFRKYR